MPMEQQSPRGGDSITILTSAGPRLTKVWDSATGKPQGYEKAQQVSVQERYVSGIYELSALLDELEGERNTCIIRGKFVGHAKARELMPAEIERELKSKKKVLAPPKEGFTFRRLTFFKPQALHFFYIDIDNFKPDGVDPVLEPEKAIDQYIAKSLPDCFQGVTYHWQLSSGAGHPDNVGILKAHVAFWLATPQYGEDLDVWADSLNLNIDPSVFRTVQPNYTAAPVFINGVEDPVPRRSGLCEGWAGDEVDLTISPVMLVRAKKERKERQDIADPRDKDNDVGLFCRTFEIEEVVERWLSDVFEFVTDTRLNWLQSASGAVEGAGITDNRQGIFNTHSTDPFRGRAANKWDLVRHYKFGHLDEELDDGEKFLLGIGQLPSNLAMRDFVATLPEMKTEAVDATASHRAAIEAAADDIAVREVAQRVALDSALDRLARDTLAGIIQNRLKDITGVKPRIDTVRAMVTLGRTGPSAQPSAPDWVKPWCYVTSSAKFFNRDTKEVMTREAFDAAHCRLLPPDEEGNRPSAARTACDDWEIPTVYELMYLPSAGDLYSIDGREYANLYRPDTVPSASVDQAAFTVLQRHIDLLVPNAEYRAKLVQWMAWVVRNPGKKVLWAVLVKGVEGDGKSILGSMMGQAMGFANVGIISPDTLAGSNFNDWAVGRCVNVIEELKLQGHNRHDVYNKIKPLITNERIELHGKGKAATTAVNTTNYLAFSNHADAIPLDQHDRRQFVLFTPWQNIEELHTAIAGLGLSVEAYWDALWEVVKNRPDAVRGFFEAIDLTGFDPNSRAPYTTFKGAVVAAGDLDDAEAIAKAIIEQGALGVSKAVVSSACLTRALSALNPPVVLHTTRVRKLMESMGFAPVEKLVWWKSAPHKVWMPTLMCDLMSDLTSVEASKVRALLDLTDQEAVEDFLQ